MSSTKKASKVWEYPTQQAQTIRPARTRTLSRHFWFTLALVGAIIVVSLYLIVPLMVFLGIVHDLVTQLLIALLILTVAEFFIFGILLKTNKSMKINTGKMRTALVNAQETDNMPFDIVVNTSTELVPVLQVEDPANDETQLISLSHQTQSTPVQPPEDLANDETQLISLPQQQPGTLARPGEDLANDETLYRIDVPKSNQAAQQSEDIAEAETLQQIDPPRRQ